MKNKKDTNELRDKIMGGIKKAVDKVISDRKVKDEEISIFQNGKVVKVKARDLK
jgi:hypothetical protein